MRIQIGTRYTAISTLSKVAFLTFVIRDEKDRLRWERIKRTKNVRLRREQCHKLKSKTFANTASS
ncbi:MAG TPA: hypothetical protein VJ464_13325 [Blastocatellia bacterium]|nr:hypothetical protein [Blastocatellia bacterium]